MYFENYVKFCDFSLSLRYIIELWIVLLKDKYNW